MKTKLVSSVALALMVGLPSHAEPRYDGAAVSVALNNARRPSDACGGRNFFDVAVPDGPFLAACQMHDACYRSAAKNQFDCDTDFLMDMRDACEVAYPKGGMQLRHAACMGTAQTYFMAVNSSVGSRHFNKGGTSGKLLFPIQQRLLEDDGDDELRTCVTVKNTSGRKLAYQVSLHDANGDWVDTEPDFGKAHLQPDADKLVCVDTEHQPFRNWDNLGDAYVVTLKVDDPDRFSVLGDLIEVDRLDCERSTGQCAH